MKKKYYIVSGGFDPIHEGHISLIRESVKLSDGVIVLINSDAWLERKKGKFFQSFNTRKIICENIKGVILAIDFDDTDNSASDGIYKVRKLFPNDDLYFANGGDRTSQNIREENICKQCNVEMVFGIGGDNKANSSSWILKNWETKK